VVAAGPASVMVARRHRSVPATLEWSCWNGISWTDPVTNVPWWVADWAKLRGEVHRGHAVLYEEFSAQGRVTILSDHKAVFIGDGGGRFPMVVDTGMHD